MRWNVIALLLLCIPIFCFCLRRYLSPSYAPKLPPGPTGLPILGSFLQLGEKPHHSLSKFAESYGPLISLRLGSITTVVASSPETARLILQKHVDPRFEAAKEFRELMWRIMESAGKPNISDYFPMFRRFDLQGVKRGVFPSYKRFHEILDGIIQERIKLRASNSTTRINDFLDVLLDQCETDGSDFSSETIKTLLVELIFGGSDTSSVLIEWAMAELLRNPHVMQKIRQELREELIFGGSDTSSVLIEWAMAELLRNPHVMQKIRKELREVISSEQNIKESDIDRLPYFQAVVKETMRLHLPAPLLLPYKAKDDIEICGFIIPKDSHVLVNVWAIARDPQHWEDPLSFLPERFLGSDVRHFRGQDYEFLPFGAGRRICLGISLGERMVHLVLASIIHKFNWKLPEGVTPESLDMNEEFGVTLKKVVPLSAIPFIEEEGSP